MEEKRVFVNGAVLCTGIQKARSCSSEPFLCLVRKSGIMLVAVSGLRLAISWEADLSQLPDQSLALPVPPAVAGLLASEAISGQAQIELGTRGQLALARMTDRWGSYELVWNSDLAAFSAPRELAYLIKEPQGLVSVPHLSFSDAAHQAVAKLGCMHATRQINPTKLAMLVDLNYGRLRVDGEVIVTTQSRRYFFDPRLVIRALEFLKEGTIGVGITPLPGVERRAYLSLQTTDGEWRVHCALLSIGKDTQKLYPLPPVQNRLGAGQ